MAGKNLTDRVYQDEELVEESRFRGNLRTALTGGRNILTVRGLDPEYHYVWVTDINGKVEHFLEMGYDHETHAGLGIGDKSVEQGKGLTKSVVSKNVGGGLTAYLMKYPLKEWNEAMNAVQDQLDSDERAWTKQLNSGQNSTYGSVKVERDK